MHLERHLDVSQSTYNPIDHLERRMILGSEVIVESVLLGVALDWPLEENQEDVQTVHVS